MNIDNLSHKWRKYVYLLKHCDTLLLTLPTYKVFCLSKRIRNFFVQLVKQTHDFVCNVIHFAVL